MFYEPGKSVDARLMLKANDFGDLIPMEPLVDLFEPSDKDGNGADSLRASALLRKQFLDDLQRNERAGDDLDNTTSGRPRSLGEKISSRTL